MSNPLSTLTGLGRLLHRAGLGLAIAGALMASVEVHAQSAQVTSMRVEVQAQESAAAMAAAQDLVRFAKHHQKAHAEGLPKGFPLAISNMAELASARVGRGFAVYTVDPADIAAADDLSAVARPTGTWRFVVRVGSRPVGLATVVQTNGQWQVVSYGGAILANDVESAMRQHGNADRSNLRFIRVFQAHADFLEVQSPAEGRARLAPLYSARQSLRMPERAAALEQNEVIPSLRAAVAANLADSQL
jgi:hypothetical protein